LYNKTSTTEQTEIRLPDRRTTAFNSGPTKPDKGRLKEEIQNATTVSWNTNCKRTLQ